MPSTAKIAEGVPSANDTTKFMVLVLDGEQKKIQLMDENGKCFKRYYTDASYYMTPGGSDSGCDEFATLTVGDAPDGKGVTLSQGNLSMQNIYTFSFQHKIKEDTYYLGMRETSGSPYQEFSLDMADPPAQRKAMVRNNLLTNVRYDMANGKATLQPTRVGSVKCKMGSQSANVVLKQVQSASEVSTFSSATARFDVDTKMTVSGGVPLTDKVDETFTMSMSETMTFTNGETITEVKKDDVTVNCPAYSQHSYDMVWEKGTYTIPYVADLERVVEVDGVPTKYVF